MECHSVHQQIKVSKEYENTNQLPFLPFIQTRREIEMEQL